MEDIICSERIKELYYQFNDIYPNILEYKQPNQFLLTISFELTNEIPFHITSIPTREIDIPLMYKNKEIIQIQYIEPIQISISFEHEKPNFQFKCSWLSIMDIIEIKKEIEENVDIYGDELFIIIYSILIEKEPNELHSSKLYSIDISKYERQKRIILYDYTKRKEEFNNQQNCECLICCEEYPTEKMIFLDSCFHYFCEECLKSQFEEHLKLMRKMMCPFVDCNCEILPFQLKGICDDTKISQYENQLVQKLIKDEGTDFIICPFCDGVNQVDLEVFEKPSPIHCSGCWRTFCSLCLQNNHQGKCSVMKTIDYYYSQDYIDHIHSSEMLRKMKKCPGCNNVVIKSYGCNFIRCFCGTCFCYRCLEPIHDYTHFQKNCVLFTEQSLREDEIIEQLERLEEIEKLIEENKDTKEIIPFYCEQCTEISKLSADDLVLVCQCCKNRVCRHCDEKNVSANHVKEVLKNYPKITFKLPFGYENWK